MEVEIVFPFREWISEELEAKDITPNQLLIFFPAACISCSLYFLQHVFAVGTQFKFLISHLNEKNLFSNMSCLYIFSLCSFSFF